MKLIGPSHVKGDAFEIHRISNELEYRENTKGLKIFVEAGWNPEHYVAVYLSKVETWNKPGEEVLSEVDLCTMKENIQSAYQRMGIAVTIE